jgi:KDO2-lipid IV(A) lauroyltransferase
MGFKFFLLFEKFLMVMPKKLRKSFFVLLANMAYYLSSRYRNIGYINLDFIYEDTISQEKKKEIIKYSFKNLLLNFLHLMELRHMSKEELEQKGNYKKYRSCSSSSQRGKSHHICNVSLLRLGAWSSGNWELS